MSPALPPKAPGAAAHPAGAAGGAAPAPAAGVAAGVVTRYTRPASYVHGNANFVTKGDDLVSKMRNPPNSGDIVNAQSAAALEKNFHVAADTSNVVKPYAVMSGPASKKFGIKGTWWEGGFITDKNQGEVIDSTYWKVLSSLTT
jgi:hypothetical protein